MGFKASLDGVLTENDTNIFLEKTVQEFIWGYDDKLTKMGRQFMPEGALKSDQFGLFAGRNHSVDARFSVNTGKGNLDKLGILKRLNNETSYYVWPGKGCDKVKGASMDPIIYFIEGILCLCLDRNLPSKEKMIGP